MMKHLYVVLIVSWLSVMNGHADGQVVTQDELQPPVETLGFPPWPLDNQPPQFVDYSGCKRNRPVYCPCQEGFTRLASGKCYLFSFQARPWQEALASCQAVGATLAYPLNVVEDSWLAAHLKANYVGITGWWLGGTDQAQQGRWIWAHNKAPLNYTNWLPGQPDLASERCLHYWVDGQWLWNNYNCITRYPFVCQQL